MRFFQLQPGEGASTTTSAVLDGSSPSPRLSALDARPWDDMARKKKKKRAWRGTAFTNHQGHGSTCTSYKMGNERKQTGVAIFSFKF